jgi:hypothetical protein
VSTFKGENMRSITIASMSLALVAGIVVATARHARAAEQPFFEGTWRCQQGMNVTVNRGFGPWYVWRSTAATESRAFVRHTDSGRWVNVGADSTGAWWSSTSPGWQNGALTFTGTYGNVGSNQPLKQIFTRHSASALTIQTWRNGTLVGQVGCNK